MVPLESKRTINPPSFAPMPRLYLELLENKDKIKKEFSKQEFIPKYDTDIAFDDDGDEMVRPKLKEQFKETKSIEKVPTKPIENVTKVKPSSKPIENVTKVKMPAKKELAKKPEETLKNSKDDISDNEENILQDDTNNEENILQDDITEDTTTVPPNNDPLESFLKKSRSIGSRKKEKSPDRKASYDKKKDDILRNDGGIPPSLQDLEDGGAFDTGGIKNMSRVSKKEQDSEQKLREYLFKYELLRKSYPSEDIPKFTINSDPEFVSKTYDDILRNLSLSDNINKYKKYLMFGFMGVEALVGNVLGFDMKGFTKQQMIEMSSYEKLIIELGEKSYVPQSKWPVELRLLGMIIMNAAFFIASKMALRATGTDVLGNMNAAANAGVNASNIQQRKKQRMSGPSINLDDIVSSEPKAPISESKDSVSFVPK